MTGGPAVKAVRLFVAGRVQGVWFRGWAVDTARKRALVRARPLPEAGLATYRVLEQRAAAMAPGWTIEVEPPVLPLPDLALDQDGAPANADSLALALWAAQRIGLPIDIAVRGDDHAPLVQPFVDGGVDARLTDGASADRAALRWRVAE